MPRRCTTRAGQSRRGWSSRTPIWLFWSAGRRATAARCRRSWAIVPELTTPIPTSRGGESSARTEPCSTSTRSRGRGHSGSVGRSTSSPTRASPSWARGRGDVSTCAKPSGCPSPMASPRGWPRRGQVQVAQRTGRSERPCRAGVTRRSSTHAAIARPGAPDTPGWPSAGLRETRGACALRLGRLSTARPTRPYTAGARLTRTPGLAVPRADVSRTTLGWRPARCRLRPVRVRRGLGR